MAGFRYFDVMTNRKLHLSGVFEAHVTAATAVSRSRGVRKSTAAHLWQSPSTPFCTTDSLGPRSFQPARPALQAFHGRPSLYDHLGWHLLKCTLQSRPTMKPAMWVRESTLSAQTSIKLETEGRGQGQRCFLRKACVFLPGVAVKDGPNLPLRGHLHAPRWKFLPPG